MQRFVKIIQSLEVQSVHHQEQLSRHCFIRTYRRNKFITREHDQDCTEYFAFQGYTPV